jgi:UDP-N-acetylbacillosamine N-acetyltransferase
VSDSKQVFIFGYSGHAYVVIESLLEAGYIIAGYFDYQVAAKNPYDLTYFGFEGKVDVKSIVQNHLVFPAVGENIIREKLVRLFDYFCLNQFVAIDPNAVVSKTAQIGSSTYVGKNVAINAQAIIGRGTIINTHAIVEHECIIEDFVHIAPNAVLCGNVQVGKYSFVGANTVVRQNTNIASDVIVGAGSVLLKSIVEKGIWVGRPAKKI